MTRVAARAKLGTAIREYRVKAGLTQRELSEALRDHGLQEGFSISHLSQVENGDVWASDKLVRALEVILRAPGRFLPLLREAKVPSSAPHETLAIDLNIFYAGRVNTSLPRSTRQDDGNVEVHVFPFGVVVAHLVDSVHVPTLTAAAVRRRELLDRSDEVLQHAIERYGPSVSLIPGSTYGLSCFMLREPRWNDTQMIRRAVHLLSVPSLLLPNYGADREEGADIEREESMMGSEEPVPDVAGFDVAGCHIGAATWSAVAVHAIQPHGEIYRELVEFEVQLQALWCYSSYCERTGDLLGEYDAEFMRSEFHRLTASGPREHLSVRLLREALITTSRIELRVVNAVDRLSSQRSGRKVSN